MARSLSEFDLVRYIATDTHAQNVLRAIKEVGAPPPRADEIRRSDLPNKNEAIAQSEAYYNKVEEMLSTLPPEVKSAFESESTITTQIPYYGAWGGIGGNNLPSYDVSYGHYDKGTTNILNQVDSIAGLYNIVAQQVDEQGQVTYRPHDQKAALEKLREIEVELKRINSEGRSTLSDLDKQSLNGRWHDFAKAVGGPESDPVERARLVDMMESSVTEAGSIYKFANIMKFTRVSADPELLYIRQSLDEYVTGFEYAEGVFEPVNKAEAVARLKNIEEHIDHILTERNEIMSYDNESMKPKIEGLAEAIWGKDEKGKADREEFVADIERLVSEDPLSASQLLKEVRAKNEKPEPTAEQLMQEVEAQKNKDGEEAKVKEPVPEPPKESAEAKPVPAPAEDSPILPVPDKSENASVEKPPLKAEVPTEKEIEQGLADMEVEQASKAVPVPPEEDPAVAEAAGKLGLNERMALVNAAIFMNNGDRNADGEKLRDDYHAAQLADLALGTKLSDQFKEGTKDKIIKSDGSRAFAEALAAAMKDDNDIDEKEAAGLKAIVENFQIANVKSGEKDSIGNTKSIDKTMIGDKSVKEVLAENRDTLEGLALGSASPSQSVPEVSAKDLAVNSNGKAPSSLGVGG